VMGPSGDIGWTWSHYEGHSKDANGNPVTVTGRFITIWRKQADGSWKVVLDAGANEPVTAGDCCKLPRANTEPPAVVPTARYPLAWTYVVSQVPKAGPGAPGADRMGHAVPPPLFCKQIPFFHQLTGRGPL